MKRILKKVLSFFLATIMVLGAAPLAGFVGLELPEFGGFRKLAVSVLEFFDGFAAKAEAATSGTCGENLTWTLDTTTGVLEISGTGDMMNYSYPSYAPWYSNYSYIKSVSLPDGLTSIGDMAFDGCYMLTNITIPDSVTNIGKCAFYNCNRLTSITIPDSVTSIGIMVFDGCDSLTIAYPGTYEEWSEINIGSINTYLNQNVILETNAERPYYLPGICGDNLTWKLYADGELVISGTGNMTDYTSSSAVPWNNIGKIESVTISKGVTSIGDCAFYYCMHLKNITIPDSVTSIGNHAFRSCNRLTSITIPNSVTSIGYDAFVGCASLTNITIPDNVLYIGFDAFSYTAYYNNENNWENDVLYIDKHLIEAKETITGSYEIKEGTLTIADSSFGSCISLTSITIPDSVTNIGNGAFNGCTSLTGIEILNGVITIGNSAFSGCVGLTSITIPNSVTSIGDLVFSGCASLTGIEVDGANKCYSSDEYGALFNKNKTKLIQYIDTSTKTSYEIPDSVTSIGNYAFYDCNNLTSITIPDSVRNIGDYAFYDCDNLTNITIPDGVTDIGDGVFSNCRNITSITIPDSVTRIGRSMFNYSSDIYTSIYYVGTPDEWNKIDIDPDNDYLMENVVYESDSERPYYISGNFDENFTFKLYISGELEISGTGDMPYIDDYTQLWAYSEKITTVTISEGVTSISSEAFTSCTYLEAITIPDSVTNIGYDAFSNTKYYNDANNWKDDVLYIGKHLYKAKDTIKGHYKIKDGTLTIVRNAFAYCDNLTSVDIPDGVTNIGISAFRECIALESITIPDSVTNIGNWAFDDCSPTIYYSGTQDEWYEIDTRFIGGGNVIFESKSERPYYLSGNYGENLTFKLYSTGELEISGSGDMANCEYSSTYWWGFEEIITSVTLSDGITSIGDYAFCECTALENITIPDSVTSIGGAAFSGCTSLKSITIPNSVTSIGGAAFADCDSLISIDIPNGVTNIDGYALINTGYYNDTNNWVNDALYIGRHLISVKQTIEGSYLIKEGTLTIATYAFALCDNLTSITIPDSVINICDSAISDCDSLGCVYIPSSVTSIGTNVLSGCRNAYICSDMEDSYAKKYADANDIGFHSYSLTIETQPGCTTAGTKKYTCECGSEYTETIPATGHTDGEWELTKEATCNENGEKIKKCTVCEEITITEIIHATGHALSEWSVKTAPTCIKQGIEHSFCSVCNYEATRSLSASGHAFGNWITEKEATVLAEGLSVRVCSVCFEREEKAIERIQIDIDENDSYGLANFTVVNAQSKEPIEGASIFISTEKDGENTFTTDSSGKVSVVLPVGKQTISAYADNCLTRNLNVTIKAGENDIPVIGLSDKETYEVELTSKEMTYEEILDAGIDTSNPSNSHVFKYELKLEFEPEIDWASLLFYMNVDGDIISSQSPSNDNTGNGGDGTGRSWTWIPPEDNNKGHFVIEPKEKGEDKIVVYPVSEYMYLIIRGEITWLKEMFDVEMLVINNSQTDTLENLICELELPDGLSLAAMVEEPQNLIQTIEHISEGESKSVHWYVRGDKEGNYDLKAKLEGTIMPFEEEINEEFVTEKAVQVWAGSALNLHFEFPDAAYHGVDYPIRITLTNVSDKSLYNVCHLIRNVEQSKIVYYSNGEIVNETYMDEDFVGHEFVKEFKPGDKIVMEISVNILFESELIEYELQKIVGLIDGIEGLLEAYKGIKAAFDALSALDKCISGCEKALDKFLKSTSYLPEAKLDLARDLYKSISKLLRKYTSSGNKALDCAARIGDSTIILILDAFASNPETFLEEHSYDDIKALIKDVEALGNLLDSDDEKALKKFDIFDAIRTAIESLPVVFALKNVVLSEYDSNTTSIPWSYSTIDTGAQYFGVSNVSSYYGNLMKAIMAEVWNEAAPSYLKLIPGLDDPLNYNDVKREIIAVEKEIAEFKAKDATGEITFNAWIERKEEEEEGLMTYALNFFEGDDFEISCDNETAVVKDGVLTFTGDGIISVIPQNTDGGILVIEDSKGNRYEYDITVVEQHECSVDGYEVILNPTSAYDGFAVKRCGVCEDVLDIEILSAGSCETHSFGEWVTDCEATCSARGIISHECSVCGYCEIEYSESSAHIPGEWTTVPATETEEEKQVRLCTACGEITEEKYIDYVAAESVSLNFNSMEIINTQSDKLIASVLPNNASNRNVVWSTSNKNIVAVSNDGTIIARSPGTATITVTTEDGDYSVSCEVTVLPRTFNVTWIADGKETINQETECGTITKPDDPAKIGYTFTGWTPGIPNSMPAENLTFTATWSANSYDAVFDANGGNWDDDTEEKTVTTEFDAQIVAPQTPEKQGYIFSKWSPEVGVMDSVDGKKFVAEWVAATDTRYTVETYTMNTSGDYEKVVQILGGTTDSTVNAVYTVETGYALNSKKSILSGTVAADNSLVLKVYIDRNTYTFTTVVDGVSTETKYLYGSMVSEPVTPTKAEYKFIKWDGTIPETMPAENVTVTAVFEKSYICPECGNEILGETAISEHIASETKVTISEGVVTSGELKPGATIAVSAPQVDGKIFSYWTVDGATVENSESPDTTIVLSNGKITITAEYEDCECKCHQGGIAGFFFKIVLFFQKLFGNNLECFCGKKH